MRLQRRPKTPQIKRILGVLMKILLLSETHRRPICPIGDPSETSTCFIRDPLETDMPDQRPIAD